MHNLAPLTALGATEARIDVIHGLTIREMPDIALASISTRLGKQAGFKRAVKAATGIDLPAPGTSASASGMTIFWIAPDQWMVEASHDRHENLAATLATAIKANGSVTEQNDGWARFDLEGDQCCAVLERLSATDSAGMTKGAATRATIEHLGCFLLCRKAAKHYSVLCPRSGAASLHHAIISAARSAL